MDTTTPVTTGLPVRLTPFRSCAAIGVGNWENMLSLLPNPVAVEQDAIKFSRRTSNSYADLRAEVQRTLHGTAKGRNVPHYADYLAAGHRGDLGDAWSSPPLCLWSPRPLIIGESGNTHLPIGGGLIAIDAETQLAAMHEVADNLEHYELKDGSLSEMLVAYEVYWGISLEDARQIFHDRNLKGVAVDKNLSLNMDQRDAGTIIARQILQNEVIPALGADPKPFSSFVNMSSRQIGKKSHHWVTLSAVRSLAVTALLGKAGIEATSGSVSTDRLPAGVTIQEAAREISEAVARILGTHTSAFADRSAITAPAVMAGLGAVLHHTLPWANDEDIRLTPTELEDILADVQWERKGWVGVAAKYTPKGSLSFAGGVKDSGNAVYNALLHPHTKGGHKIRGKIFTDVNEVSTNS
ncbi:DNA sulfur modification protein DndB [Streptosporangium carneum]|uniref:Uncharacterized protein n=1 Tax=Streptosporangium carneum TaxID=47481 RepID=A0A9W6MAK5_9ACTN|nr:DNA sulfur modification protein DndB [Streptosporangium carneum]GLK07404.1 hypothetical protein GCM10017600_08090 [Streptosporangium carneum]